MVNVKLTTGEVVKFEKPLERLDINSNTYMLEVFVKGGKRFYFPFDNVAYFYSDKDAEYS